MTKNKNNKLATTNKTEEQMSFSIVSGQDEMISKYRDFIETISTIDLINEIRRLGLEVRNIILTINPLKLMSFIYIKFATAPQKSKYSKEDHELLMEYIHAALVSSDQPGKRDLEKDVYENLIDKISKIKELSIIYVLKTPNVEKSEAINNGAGKFRFMANMTWLTLRGKRYQIFEREFYRYVLKPHSEALKRAYGIDSNSLAKFIFDISQSLSTGLTTKFHDAIKAYSGVIHSPGNRPNHDNNMQFHKKGIAEAENSIKVVKEILNADFLCVNKITDIPKQLLSDISFTRGENEEFFNKGEFRATPFNTFPVRKKPFINIDGNYYVTDPYNFRDSFYRTILHLLKEKIVSYAKEFNERQKNLGESAFFDIMKDFLPGAYVMNEVYYRNPETKQWVENDTLIIIDDVLILVEAKSGASASIASPQTDFKRHEQSIVDLITKAYDQCARFFRYIDSSTEVPLYKKVNKGYEKVCVIRKSDYRKIIPIGLTIEAFTPFSSCANGFAKLEPLLGKYGFISISVDDLITLKHGFSMPGEFIHYLTVRQSVSCIKQAFLFDEMDHLGAYLTFNRVDKHIIETLVSNDINLYSLGDMSNCVDRVFEKSNVYNDTKLDTKIPLDVNKLLGAINKYRPKLWLRIDNDIRDFDYQSRLNFDEILGRMRKSINEHKFRYFVYDGILDQIYVFLYKHGTQPERNSIIEIVNRTAELASDKPIALLISLTREGFYKKASVLSFERTEVGGFKAADNWSPLTAYR